jgi:heptosyltransferase-3
VRRLLIRPGAIGDCVVSLPALECLRAHYTEVWVASPNVPLIRFADRVRAIAETGLDLLEIPGQHVTASLIGWLRGFDSIVSWYGSNREEFRAAVCELNLPFQFFPALPCQPGMHAVDFYLQQARTISARLVDGVPRIDCPRTSGSYAVMHPFSGSPKKNWPLERFRELARILGQRMPVEWCAGPEENLPEARRFDDLYELACWLAGARLYIGNDSGITHLAAAVGTPVLALFGPTDAEVWAPRGVTVEVIKTPLSSEPMECIPLAAVVETVERMR